MVTVKITCNTGNTWITSINTSFPEAVRYFMGQEFTREDDAGMETVDRVILVEQVES